MRFFPRFDVAFFERSKQWKEKQRLSIRVALCLMNT